MTDNINSQTGNNSCQEEQMKISSLIHSREELHKLSNEQLISLLIEHNYSLNAIDVYYGFSKETTRRLFKKRKIKYKELIENHKKSIKNDYNKNPNKCIHCGKELDWEHRNNKFCSSSCSASVSNLGKARNPNGINGLVKGSQKSVVGKNIINHISWDKKEFKFRSSHELDFAKKLDANKTHYEVENLKIKYFDSEKHKYRFAFPDFYLPDTNEIIEIKSDFTLVIQEMIDRFKAYKEAGYSVKLILEHKEVNLYKGSRRNQI